MCIFRLVAETHCSANINAPNTTGVVVTVTVTCNVSVTFRFKFNILYEQVQ